MDDDSFSEVSTQGWLGRIGDSLKGLLFGGVLAAVSVGVLFWNEGRAVRRAEALKEGAGAVVSVSADKVDPANEGRLVHLTALATTRETLADGEFGVSTNVLKLRRVAEMYQWEEKERKKKEKNLGGSETTTKTYEYALGWSERVIDSKKFKQPEGHTNPVAMPYASRQVTAEKIAVGAFGLSSSLAGKINNFADLPVERLEALPEALRSKAKLHERRVYLGGDPAAPQVGDVKVGFRVVRPAVVSLVARQVKGTFEPFATRNGGSIELLQVGELSAGAMFKRAEEANAFLTWGLRVGGFVLMWFGFMMITKPLAVLADVVPFIGNVVGFGLGLLAFLLAGVISLVTVAVAWIVYRPLLGAVLLALAIGLPFLVRQMRQGKRAPTPV